jgi:hypothetical protein
MKTINFAPHKKEAKLIQDKKEFDCLISFYKPINPIKKNYAHMILIDKKGNKVDYNIFKNSIFLIDNEKYKLHFSCSYDSEDFIGICDFVNSYQEQKVYFTKLKNVQSE